MGPFGATLVLPMFPELTTTQINFICDEKLLPPGNEV